MFINMFFFFPFGFFPPIRCFIPNAYAALFTAALVPLMCLVVVFVVFIHAYQVTPQWKAYDDIFRGRTNAAGMMLLSVSTQTRWTFRTVLTVLTSSGNPTRNCSSVDAHAPV